MGDLQILHTEISIGLENPFTFLHVTDTHISLYNEMDRRDDPDKPELAIGRRAAFDGGVSGRTEAYFEEAIRYAREKNIPIIHTGDLIDFLSYENFRYMDKFFAENDVIYAAGNHDFCHYVGRAREDYAYKWSNIKYVAPHVPQNMYFYSEVRNGVNLVTMDDTYYLITHGQEELLRAEAAKGLPIVLFMHVPLYTEDYCHEMLVNRSQPCAYLTGAPDSVCNKYSDDRRLQQTPDADTLHCIDYIMHESAIRAVVCGHTHINYEGPLQNGIPQITTHGSYAGYAREIVLK